MIIAGNVEIKGEVSINIQNIIVSENLQISALDKIPGSQGTMILKQDDLGGYTISLAEGNYGSIPLNTLPRAKTRLDWIRDDESAYWTATILNSGLPRTTKPIFAINDYYNTLDIFHALGYSEIEISTNNGPWVQFEGPINFGAVDRPAGYWRARVKGLEPDRLVSAISYSNPVFAAQNGFDYELSLTLS